METQTTVQNRFTYSEYHALIRRLVAENKSTGPDQSEEIVYYTGLNLVRMERITKTFSFTEELLAAIQNIKQNYHFVVLTEAWCGDAAQAVPIFDFIERESKGKIKLTLLLRDENLELMDQYLTNGGRSIPKLIVYNESDEVVATWGPRPEALTQHIQELKEENKDADYTVLIEKMQLWYAKDRTLSSQKEFAALLETLK